ncbi:hypothetical protein [uncultured Roseobacter sp.]|uniref:hypothetical protein n=1 Tax=uncultured Roseobacter sp. TaxID=114847 RepID=UPI0026053677|nr:hypothetical protein [uncultured Roseobacter sp.]
MRDDRNRWPATVESERPNLVRDTISMRYVSPARQTVISGNFEDCLALSGLETAVGGGTGFASGETYALRQRRDRVVVINGPDIADGWHSEHNVAVSDMTSAYSVLEMTGARGEQLIATGTEFNGDRASASVSRLWHGFGILLYRYGAEDVFRLHVRSALADAVWDMLERQIDSLANVWADPREKGEMAKDMDGAKLTCKEAS